MGQQIAVMEKPSPNAGVGRFEANRTLTGMGHEVFRSAADAIGPRPAAKLARDLLATGEVTAVHMYGNMITVDLANGPAAPASTMSCATCTSTGSRAWRCRCSTDFVADAPAAAAAARR